MLPASGELHLGGVHLPPGRQVGSLYGPDEPVAWITDASVPNPGPVWLALSEMTDELGLQPVLIPSFDYPGMRPLPRQWEEYFRDLFLDPRDPAEIDYVDASEILRDLWGEGATSWILLEERQPFAREFPGLAPRSEQKLSSAEIMGALASLPAAPVGLVVADRPADVLTVTGWVTTAFDNSLPLSAVLRSWEDRFGARLLQAGPSAEIRLLVERPPRTPTEALQVAAEHWAFCDGWIDERHGERSDLTNIQEIAPLVINNPIWGFWWD